ncbi:phosphatase PAP2 family protein [Nocardia yamanashiensis]|uniref:phosphatase PAP2 family protein n=1 Tax=Nocardia yamanashiensis TaxID=209247 RepID=UPI001E3B5CE6|nr:phosphatase PAP2 family protein [Nocardia yamanashiensis]UGT40878.1 phosphatase PAP2 family protein [Nocardia yamanashiensis]
MLLDGPRSQSVGEERRSLVPSKRVLIAGLLTGVPALFIALQIVASRNGFLGPLESLAADFAGTPKSVTVPWAGLGLALIGLTWKRRFYAVGIALGIDIAYQIVRTLSGGPLALGNGPVMVLTGIVVLALVRWQGVERSNALHAAALGILLVFANKVADVWLYITVLAGPQVLDEHVVLVDHALADPSWMMGQLLEFLGPVVTFVLHWVYIELPLDAMIVAVWQLRRVAAGGGWPSHYLVRTFLTIGLIGPIVYVIFPVVGPIFAYGSEGHSFALGDYWPNLVPPLDLTPGAIPFDKVAPRNCMPSLHTAWALSLFLHSRRDVVTGLAAPRWLRWGGTFWLIATISATLGFGYHYGADLIAGAVLCLAIESALRMPERGWDAVRIQLVAGGAALFAAMLLSYQYLSVQFAEYPGPAGILLVGAFVAYAYAFYRTWFGPVPAEAPAEVSARA